VKLVNNNKKKDHKTKGIENNKIKKQFGNGLIQLLKFNKMR
jgi:hypothetical protein